MALFPAAPPPHIDEERVEAGEGGGRLLPWDYLILDEGHKVGRGRQPKQEAHPWRAGLGVRLRLLRCSGGAVARSLSACITSRVGWAFAAFRGTSDVPSIQPAFL